MTAEGEMDSSLIKMPDTDALTASCRGHATKRDFVAEVKLTLVQAPLFQHTCVQALNVHFKLL